MCPKNMKILLFKRKTEKSQNSIQIFKLYEANQPENAMLFKRFLIGFFFFFPSLLQTFPKKFSPNIPQNPVAWFFGQSGPARLLNEAENWFNVNWTVWFNTTVPRVSPCPHRTCPTPLICFLLVNFRKHQTAKPMESSIPDWFSHSHGDSNWGWREPRKSDRAGFVRGFSGGFHKDRKSGWNAREEIYKTRSRRLAPLRAKFAHMII